MLARAKQAQAKLAQAKQAQGDLRDAMKLLESAQAGAEALGNAWDTARVTSMLGALACQRQRYTQATRYYLKSLKLFRPFASPGFSAWSLEGFAAVLAAMERHTPSIRLYAAATALRASAQTPAPPAEQETIDTNLAIAQRQLGGPAYTEAWRAGATLTVDAAIAEALAEGALRLDPKE